MVLNEVSAGEFINSLPDERKDAVSRLRSVIIKNLPEGFEETVGGGMLHYVVPHSLYPGGYHCNPEQPLPFLSVASQKNNISLYHMGIYSKPELLEWFTGEYPKHARHKLDMGKSCIRFKKPEAIPYELIGQLCSKMSPAEWIETYEQAFKRK